MMEPSWRIQLLGGLRAAHGERSVTRFRTRKTMHSLTRFVVMAAAVLALVAGSGALAAEVRITGTVMDINGPLVVVRNDLVTKDPTLNFTIHTVMLPTLVTAPAGLAPGKTVAVQGQLQQGCSSPPASASPAAPPGRLPRLPRRRPVASITSSS
jgi:hypothetical protein